MSNFLPSPRLLELFDAVCEERISDADFVELETYLQDKSVREQFLKYCQIHSDLCYKVWADRAGRKALEAVVPSMAPIPLPDAPTPIVPGSTTNILSIATDPARKNELQPSVKSSTAYHSSESLMQMVWKFFASRPIRVGVCAAAILIVAGYWLYPGNQSDLVAERDPQPIATLTEGDHAEWANGFKPQKGTKLSEGQSLNLQRGTAQISLSSGVDMTLHSPCSIVLTNKNQVKLGHGAVSVQLADWANSFTVVTESIHIVDLGKRFFVSVDPDKNTIDAHAIDGKLRLLAVSESYEDDEQSELLSSGEAVRIHTESNEKTHLKADESLFDSSLTDTRPFKPLEIFNTGIGLKKGDEDPNWRIVASTAPGMTLPGFAKVRHASKLYLPNAPKESQWLYVSKGVLAPANCVYTFETQFDATGYDLKTITLAAQVLADDGVISVRLNGQPVAFKPWIINGANPIFNAFTKIEFNSGFVEGVNTIQFDVWNGNYPNDKKSLPNSMALRVEWEGFGRLKKVKAPPKSQTAPTVRHHHLDQDFQVRFNALNSNT